MTIWLFNSMSALLTPILVGRFMEEKGASQTPLCDSPLLNFRAFSPKPTLES